jgi:hypothetical protein
MSAEKKIQTNVKQAVPFFGVSSLEASLRFYVDGLGCRMTNRSFVRKGTIHGTPAANWEKAYTSASCVKTRSRFITKRRRGE